MVRRSARVRPGITEPVPRPLQKLLRQAVLDHATAEPRRAHPPVLHVGVPGRRSRRFTLAPADELDHALRTDIVEAMLRPSVDRGVVPLIWLTRRVLDRPEVEEDHRWAAAVGTAGGELGLLLDLVVVTRRSWHDPRTGVGRDWKRVRDR